MSLRDIAYDQTIYKNALNERVTWRSLMRSVSTVTVQGQYHRLAIGGARLSRYKFTYIAKLETESATGLELTFDVVPESNPPTNIHVIIGRNGVGKTRLLDKMCRAIKTPDSIESNEGQFIRNNEEESSGLFANLVSVTFSAFDPFDPITLANLDKTSIPYTYIGLKPTVIQADGSKYLKNPEMLQAEFVESVVVCVKGARADRWRKALEMLESDPIFGEAEVAELATIENDSDLKKAASTLFMKFSSGHKIVLLTITRLVEAVEEQTLILLDEPEAHLHPPLLSAFVRALSELLTNRNGVAIIATHSPVILQEVPRNCVWKLRRVGAEVSVERPEMETFGENVGVLTREVFGLEVTHSGFHKILRKAVDEYGDYDAVVEHFDGELGGEAKAIVRALLAAR